MNAASYIERYERVLMDKSALYVCVQPHVRVTRTEPAKDENMHFASEFLKTQNLLHQSFSEFPQSKACMHFTSEKCP